MKRFHGITAACLILFAGLSAPVMAASCAAAPDPVASLDYGSRYTADSKTRSDLDEKASAEMDAALKPIDDFLRNLTDSANAVYDKGADKRAIADCVVSQIASWAAANALGDLQTDTANLTIGSRIAGFGLVLVQVLPYSKRKDDAATIKGWMTHLIHSQMAYWEEAAPVGARQGNLRAWSALAASATASFSDDAAMRAWATWSVSYILCKASDDGSLPQEMSRGKYALKYQLHAIAPLVVSLLLLDRQGITLEPTCDHAIERIVGFALADLETGAASEKITGTPQSFFDGTEKLDEFRLAWLEPYLLLNPTTNRDQAEALVKKYRPMSYSKLGGNQSLIWKTGK